MLIGPCNNALIRDRVLHQGQVRWHLDQEVTYDAVTIAEKAWCSRLGGMYDAAGERGTVVFPTTGTAAKLLPLQDVGIARDTTWFTYGALKCAGGFSPAAVVQ